MEKASRIGNRRRSTEKGGYSAEGVMEMRGMTSPATSLLDAGPVHTIDEAHAFFTAPLGLVEEPGANNSAIDNAGDSTNSWVNATDISVRWHTCAAMADIIAKAPPGTQVTGHDQAHAFCFSPVVAKHKSPHFWKCAEDCSRCLRRYS
ncbi:hypothetical protein B0H14DRAFT_3137240 [Mycena olivaceomarginata]|nr:hypothetical protein B0H14DRAFT_3137240 [Mycena olivaceomarginata]